MIVFDDANRDTAEPPSYEKVFVNTETLPVIITGGKWSGEIDDG
jgi:hypothetical protein